MTTLFDSKRRRNTPSRFGRGLLAYSPVYHATHSSEDDAWWAAERRRRREDRHFDMLAEQAEQLDRVCRGAY